MTGQKRERELPRQRTGDDSSRRVNRSRAWPNIYVDSLRDGTQSSHVVFARIAKEPRNNNEPRGVRAGTEAGERR